MEAPTKELAEIKEFLTKATHFMEAEKWEDARGVLESAQAIDPNNAHICDMLTEVYKGLGDDEQVEVFHARAADIRKHNWEKEVEAEIRGRHDVMGGAARHEIP
ncbi:MAG: hypothetical protein OEW12_02425 [Deltaproteobacteria bacterium]|nr:hypothetical protein [Deltaproteobacteria bacterium]